MRKLIHHVHLKMQDLVYDLLFFFSKVGQRGIVSLP